MLMEWTLCYNFTNHFSQIINALAQFQCHIINQTRLYLWTQLHIMYPQLLCYVIQQKLQCGHTCAKEDFNLFMK